MTTLHRNGNPDHPHSGLQRQFRGIFSDPLSLSELFEHHLRTHTHTHTYTDVGVSWNGFASCNGLNVVATVTRQASLPSGKTIENKTCVTGFIVSLKMCVGVCVCEIGRA